MPTTPLEAEDTIVNELLEQTLLSQDNDDDDDDIISQYNNNGTMSPTSVNIRNYARNLLSTNNTSIHSKRLHHQRCQCKKVRIIMIIIFAVLVWIGLFASISSIWSCDLYNVEYPKGELSLSITGIGVYSYQHEVNIKDDNQKVQQHNNSIPETKKVCVDYTAVTKHTEISGMEDFFPSSNALQIYSIIAPSCYFFGLIILFTIAGVFPEIFIQPGQTLLEQYPSIIHPIITSGVFLILAGIFHTITMHDLSSSTSGSPICNPKYSDCIIGTGGMRTAFAILTSFVSGLATCTSIYLIGRRARTRRILDEG